MIEVYLGPCQVCIIEFFAEIVTSVWASTISAKISINYVWQSPLYTCGWCHNSARAVIHSIVIRLYTHFSFSFPAWRCIINTCFFLKGQLNFLLLFSSFTFPVVLSVLPQNTLIVILIVIAIFKYNKTSVTI